LPGRRVLCRNAALDKNLGIAQVAQDEKNFSAGNQIFCELTLRMYRRWCLIGS
jgi:hypothetical protein